MIRRPRRVEAIVGGARTAPMNSEHPMQMFDTHNLDLTRSIAACIAWCIEAAMYAAGVGVIATPVRVRVDA